MTMMMNRIDCLSGSTNGRTRREIFASPSGKFKNDAGFLDSVAPATAFCVAGCTRTITIVPKSASRRAGPPGGAPR